LTEECERSRIEEEALRLLRPDPMERAAAEEAAREALRLLDAVLREAGFSGYVMALEGSFAKDTWLRGSLDFDVFVLFPPEHCLRVVEGFAERLAEALRRRGLQVELRYAQHPYVRVLVKGFWVEAVPGCRVSDPSRPLTPVDRTPFHTSYIASRLGAAQRDEVRLLKSFLKGIGVYGAEIAVRGFSGYLTELLIARYGCFRHLLEAAAHWKPPVVVEVEPGTAAHVRRDNSVLVVPDPVDPRRNVAAAVSARSLAAFILAARLYLEEPCTLYFHAAQPPPPPVGPWSLGPRLGNIVAVELRSRAPQPPDTMWGVARRLARLVDRLLASTGFRVAAIEPWASETKIIIWAELEERILPPHEARAGPRAWDRVDRVKRFLEKYGATWISEDGSLATLARRRAVEATRLLAERLPRQLPRTAREIGEPRIHCCLDAARLLEEADPRWAWEQAARMLYWLHLASLCKTR